MNFEEIKYALEILIAFKEGKKLQFFDSWSWDDSLVSSEEQLINNLFAMNNGKRYRIKPEPEPFKVIVDELYKFNDTRKKYKEAFDEGKTIQYKVSTSWIDFSLDNIPKIGSGLTYTAIYVYGKLFACDSNFPTSNLRIKPETVTLYSRKFLSKAKDNNFHVYLYNYTHSDENEIEGREGFVKWIEDKQEHKIEV